MRKRIVFWTLAAAAVLVITVGVYHSFLKKMPEGTSVASGYYAAGPDDIRFLRDVTYIDEEGRRIVKQEIYDKVFLMIDRAENFILADIFLINSFQGQIREEHRLLSSELASALCAKKKNNPEIKILLITDEINSIYGGIEPPEINLMKKCGVEVVYTDMSKMRDGNILYSPFWRVFVQWLGDPDEPGGIIPNPLSGDGRGISIRSTLKMLNFRANHRKIVIADSPGGVEALIMSGNASDASSAHTNTALLVKNNLWREIIDSELKIAEFSGYSGGFAVPDYAKREDSGEASVMFAAEGKIADELEKMIGTAAKGDSIEMLMFFLSDEKIINSLVAAAARGAAVRVILDPNKDAFGMKQNGMPNRRSAEKLVKRSKGKVKVRWYDTHGEQCHAKMTIVTAGGRQFMTTGSANMTRRNLRDYNLEANVFVSGRGVPAINEALLFFDSLWENRGMHCTVPYEKYKKENLFLGLRTDFQEATGLCIF